MKKIIAITILFTLMTASNASADIKAGMLFNLCETENRRNLDFAYCLGYVTGYMSNLDITSNRKNMKIEPNYNLYFDLMKPCMPLSTKVSDIVDLIVEYFGKRKEKFDKPAALVLMEALHDRYPCDNGI